MFKAIGGLGNISSILSNLQHIGPKVKQVTEQMRAEQITASAGDGAVVVTLNGIGEMLDIQIHAEGRAHAELQAWIVEATNLAGAAAKKKYAQAISNAADELNLKLPGLEAILGSLAGGA